MAKKKHVAVLLGGLSAERDVSLVSGKAVHTALWGMGYEVTSVDVGRDVAEVLKKLKPDVAFNALHGTYGEDGCIQGVCEFLQIPYTHSGVLASAIAMNKPFAKYVFESAGIRCASGKVFTGEQLANLKGKHPIPLPYVVKPTNNGSSVGVQIFVKGDNRTMDTELLEDEQEYLVEKFIPGKELSVAVLGGKALAVIEIRPKAGFYDYKNKYTSGNTEYILPAQIPPAVKKAAMKMAEDAHRVLGCRGVTRSDIRYDDSKKGASGLYLLEVNTHPGMTPLSLTPKMAAYAGIDFATLLEKLIKEARCDNS
ncbi:MAG: D-alanine--D-alanine ligase [Proteobacteria bacterium]|nr:D-alanine--D-alanine ligase [Pseudomonadota bacterium]